MSLKCKLLLLLFIAFPLFFACNSSENGNSNNFKIGSEVAVNGQIVCLPKKGDGPVTLECRFGLKVDSTYYGLKDIPHQAIKNGIVRTGNIVKVAGTVIEAEADRTYNVATAIDINQIELVKKGAPKQNIFETKAFRISIPPAWVKQDSISTSWSMLSSETNGKVIVGFKTEDDYLKNTNFGHAQITIGYSDDPDAVKHCHQPVKNNERVKQSEVNINGITYIKISVTDAGAGNRYATDSYRVIYNGKCWAIESVLHYSPIEFYGKESEVTEFNRAETKQMIHNIIQSFRFK